MWSREKVARSFLAKSPSAGRNANATFRHHAHDCTAVTFWIHAQLKPPRTLKSQKKIGKTSVLRLSVYLFNSHKSAFANSARALLGKKTINPAWLAILSRQSLLNVDGSEEGSESDGGTRWSLRSSLVKESFRMKFFSPKKWRKLHCFRFLQRWVIHNLLI